MGIANRYLASDDLFVSVWEGLVTLDEWKSFAAAQLTDPRWPPGKFGLADISSLDPSALTRCDVEEMAVLYQKRLSDRRGWKFAIVAHAGWDLAESFEREVVSANTIVFSLASAACGWLQVDRERTLSAIKELRKELRAAPAG